MNNEYDKQSGMPGKLADTPAQDGAEEQSKGAEAASELGLNLIGEQLRKSYQELLSEPVPDKFLKILDEMERRETGKDEK